MAQKIEGFVARNFESRLDAGGLPSFCTATAHHHYTRPATITIHDSPGEPVYTEREVKALLRDIMNDQTSADIANGYVNVVIGWAELFRKHGITLP